MTRRRWIIIAAVSASALAAVFFGILTCPAEPSHKGKRLSEWVEDITPAPLARSPGRRTWTVAPQTRVVKTSTGQFVVLSTSPPTFMRQAPQHSAAVRAIREIGTNALPHLLRTIYSQDPPWKTKLVDAWRKQKWVKLPFKTAAEKQAHALPALRELGPAATVWMWVEILTNHLASIEVQQYAAATLSSFGKDATGALTALLRMQDHPDRKVRESLGWAIHYCDRDGFLIALYNARYSTNADLRAGGAWSLGHIGKNPDMSIPALARAASDASAHVREAAIDALVKLDPVSNETTNLIFRALSDPERRVRKAATNALERMLSEGRAPSSP